MRLFPDFDDNLRKPSGGRPSSFSKAFSGRTGACWICCAPTTVRQRAAGEHYGMPHIYGTLPAGDARRRQRAGRTASPGQHPDGDVLRDQDLARRPRQVDARQPWACRPPAAAGRAGAEGQHGGRQPVGSQAPGRTPEQPDLLGLPQPDGSTRPLAGEVRRGRPTSRPGFPSMRLEACPTAAGLPTSRGSKTRCCAGPNCSWEPWPKS